MNSLSIQERYILQHLIANGYQQAAQAFSSVVNQKVYFETLDVEFIETDAYRLLNHADGELIVVVTDIMGEVGGSSYLLLSEQEQLELQRACFPNDSKSAQCQVMGEELIKEIDNIISAAVITEFSNVLDLHIYGGVPQLSTVSSGSVNEKIKQDFETKDNYYLIADTRFRFVNNTQLQPQFFWRLTPDFIQRVRNYAATSLADN